MASSGAPSTGGFGGYGGPTGFANGGGNPGAPVSGGPSAGRQLPAWSDLTGATTGVNGVDPYPGAGRGGPNGPAGPGSERGFAGGPGFGGGPGMDRPIPGGPAPDRFGPGPDRFGAVPGDDRVAFAHGEPLPQRRATEPGSPDGDAAAEARPVIPRQMPASPEARTGFAQVPNDYQEAIEADLVEESTSFVAPLAAAAPPPAWPPVAPGPAAVDADEAAPAVPEDLASALDITSEMPRVTDDENASREPTGWNSPSGVARLVPEAYGAPPVVPAAYTAPPLVTGSPIAPSPVAPLAPSPRPVAPPQVPRAEPTRFAAAHPDDTMELPIFRELESAWFRSRGSGVSEAPEVAVGPAWPVAGDTEPIGQPGSAGQPRPALSWPSPAPAPAGNLAAAAPAGATDNGYVGSSQMPVGRMPMPEPDWRSSADDGWLAASAAAEPEVAGLTDAGLPKRVPMAQLVPGGVEKNTANANRRSPEQVRGLLSAYHRGVQRGRNRDDDRTPESSTTAGHSPQGGKEQDA
jgi:hypothetical protein